MTTKPLTILSIETSCDETAVAIIRFTDEKVEVLGDTLYSQVAMHEQYGGVFPTVAKREHARTLTPLLKDALQKASLYREAQNTEDQKKANFLKELLSREFTLGDELVKLLESIERPTIDHIAVTHGPGLEPALWVGLNFAKALSYYWDIPLIPINHMEGHIFASFLKRSEENADSEFMIHEPKFPILALLISGGHTQLILTKEWGKYEILGETRDDAVGEAYDKVARMLSLPYPGGPQISKLAELARLEGLGGIATLEKENLHLPRESTSSPQRSAFKLPRPMLHTPDFAFSFAGLKTAVLYTIKKLPELTEDIKKELALEFENAVTEVLITKTKKALRETDAQTLVIGGGVSANIHIRREFTSLIEKEDRGTILLIPSGKLSTDNAVMIGITAYQKIIHGNNPIIDPDTILANGNLSL